MPESILLAAMSAMAKARFEVFPPTVSPQTDGGIGGGCPIDDSISPSPIKRTRCIVSLQNQNLTLVSKSLATSGEGL
jgi:hypothetical protein